jgi:cell division protein FtsI/penicillin-binding protein 2
VGKERFGARMRAFKFGQETGIDLPNEVHGLVDNLSSPRMIEYSNASFGQGIAMTPIETVRALAAVANGGILVTPHVAKKIQYESGASQEVTFDDTTRVISPQTSETVTRMLVEVVDKALLHGSVSLPHYSVAAKTGTAQIAKAGARGYYDDRYLHSFFGYFPAYNPKFIIFLYTVEPRGAKYASETLTTPFMDITKFLINYYDIPPDR